MMKIAHSRTSKYPRPSRTNRISSSVCKCSSKKLFNLLSYSGRHSREQIICGDNMLIYSNLINCHCETSPLPHLHRNNPSMILIHSIFHRSCSSPHQAVCVYLRNEWGNRVKENDINYVV